MSTYKYLKEYQKKGQTYYLLRKQYQGKQYTIIHTPQQDTALKVWYECEKSQWIQHEVMKIKEKYEKQQPLLRDTQYITPDKKGGYRIQKWTQGRTKYYGKTRTLPHAKKIRDYLITHNWKKPILQKRRVSPNKYLVRQNNGKYTIRRRNINYGTYNTYHEAVQARKKLITNEWDKKYSKTIKDNPNRYIHTYKGVYTIKKVINGETTQYGTYHTLEEARSERDFWESINFDWDLLDLY